MEAEKIEYENGDGKTYRRSSHRRGADELDVRSRSRKNESYVRRSLLVKDGNRHDGKKKFKRVKEHSFDSEVGDIASVQMESSGINKNCGLVSLKYFKEMDEKFSLALKEKDLLISSLMKDIQIAEDENSKCKMKLIDLKEKFKLATTEMVLAEEAHAKLSEKYKNLQEQYEALKVKDESSNKQVTELMNRIKSLEDDLNNQPNKPENELEECWELIKLKEKEIKELEIKLQPTGDHLSHSDTSEILIYQKQLFEKNEKIKDLESKLKDAVMEIEESSKTLLMLKSERSITNSDMVLTGLSYDEDYLTKSEEKHLKRQLETLNYKLSLATEKLRRFEQNEYGLPEALAEVEELKRQIYMRDLNIADLVSKINTYSSDPENFMAKRRGVDGEFIQPKRRKTKRIGGKYIFGKCLDSKAIYKAKLPEYVTQEEMMNKILKWSKTLKIFHLSSMKFQEKCDKEAMQAFLENEKGTPSKINSVHLVEEDVAKQDVDEEIHIENNVQDEMNNKEEGEVGSKLEEMIKENDYLRKGMHEILESIRIQDGEYYASIKRIHLLALHFASSDIKLESKSLEHLLHALDQRHVSGWYHPAMRLEAQLKSTEGVNAALREQLRFSRLEERKAKEKLQVVLSRLNSLENEVVINDTVNLPTSIKSALSETWDLADHLNHLLKEHEMSEGEFNIDQNRYDKFKEDLQKLYDRFIVLHQKYSIFYQKHANEKMDWDKEKNELIFNLEKSKAYVETLESNIKAVNDEVTNGKESNSAERAEFVPDPVKEPKEIAAVNESTKVESSEELMKRKYCILENYVNNLKKENEKLQMNMQDLKTLMTQKEENNTKQNEISKQQISNLKNEIDELVPRSSVEGITKQLNELIIKYRAILQKNEYSILNEQILSQVQEELHSIKKDKQDLKKKLISSLRKLHQYETIIHPRDQVSSGTTDEDEFDNKVSVLSEKIAVLEVGEITAKQNLNHCEQMCSILKSQLEQLKEANMELETTCSSLKQENHELQLTEMGLHDQLNFISLSSFPEISQQLQDAELRLVELQEENLKLQMQVGISEEKIESLQLLKSMQDGETESLRRQVLDHLSDDDDKAHIAKINDDLLHIQNLLAISNDKYRLLEKETVNLNSENTKMKQMLHEKDIENLSNKQIMARYYRQLLRYILEMRIRYSGGITLQVQEKMHRDHLLLLEECTEAKLKAGKLEDTLLASLSSSEVDKTLLKDLYTKETQAQQLISTLIDQVKTCENKLQKQKECILKLENENAQLEKEYELNKSQWENREYELLKELGHCLSDEPILDERELQNSTDEPISIPEDINKEETPHSLSSEKQLDQDFKGQERNAVKKCSHNEEIVAQQNIIKELIEQLAKVEFELNEKEIDLKELQGIMSFHTNCQLEKKCKDNTLKTETHAQLPKEPCMREFNFAYKITLDALNVMLNQKDVVLSRYKKLVLETREAHAKTLLDLNAKQNLNMQEKPSNFQDISMGVSRNYRAVAEQLVQPPIPTEMPQFSGEIAELQKEVTLHQRKCDYLAVQLNLWESEAHHYKALADKRQVELEELLARVESQRKSCFDGPYNTTVNASGNDVTSERNVFLIETAQKEHQPEVDIDSSVATKTYKEVGTNTDILNRADVENWELNHSKKKSDKAHGFSLSKEEAEDIDQELETISNLLEKAEEGSDEKHSQKSVGERNIAHGIRRREAARTKSTRTSPTVKVDKLKDDIKILEQQLHNSQLQLEAVQKEAEMDTKRNVELARWGESKKWQQTVDKLQERLKSEKNSTENLKKINISLKDAIARLQREKTILECKVKNAVSTKELEPRWSPELEKRMEVLQKRISNLEKTIFDLEALNIAQKKKLEKYEAKIKNSHEKQRGEQDNKNHYEGEDKDEISGGDIPFEIKMLKEEREKSQKENEKALNKINSLEEEMEILKEQKSALDKKILVFLGREETASMIHNEVNALRVELARKTQLLHDVKGVLIRIREKTKNKKAIARGGV